MFKKIFFVLIVHSSLIFAQKQHLNNIECAPQLQEYIAAIQKFPEGRTLIESIQQEGAFGIAVNTYLSQDFGAFWDPDQRLIMVSMSSSRSKGSLIASIIFELHNAAINSKLNHLDRLASQGKIDHDSYVEAVERLEYQNSLMASKLAAEGIRLGFFPEGAYLPTHSSFEEYYKIQQMAGHSNWISQTYYKLSQRSRFF